MNFLKAMFGNYSKREVKRVQPICDKVLALEDKYAAMSESELKNQTTILKERLANGETTDDILPEAFATCREAGWRVLGMKHFPVQIIGGIVLHQGRIAEMKTGEGKTLVATLPCYLNALEGKGVHVVTVNDYLAKRDSEQMGKIYKFLGLTVGLITHDKVPAERKEAYGCDISQYGDYRINGHNLSSRLQEIGLSVEVRGISTQTCRTHAQREERLSQRFEQHVLIYLREIRLQQELHSLHRTRQRAGSYHNHNQQEEEHRHQYLGCFLYTIAHTAHYHHVGKQDKTYCP